MKKMFLCTIILSLFLTGCSSSDDPGSAPANASDGQTVNKDVTADLEEDTSESSSESSPAPTNAPNLKTYSDSYVSFTYDADLFTYNTSSGSDGSFTVIIDCPSMPIVSENEHNTVIGFSTIPNPNLPESSEYLVELALNVFSKSICEGLFVLRDDEYIVDESSTYSNFTSEYYMEINDGSKCYAKALNYNDYITTVIMRLCPYSSDYNDSIMAIYESAKSEYGNFDLSAILESSATEPEPTATSEPASTPEPPASPEPTPESTPVPESTPSSAATKGQKNALRKAKDYLNYSAFSYNGLIGQLEYEGFTTEEATYAVDNCGADWREQALKKAKDYLSYSAFSYDGLIGQLEYEGFTSEEAAYAVDNCGADWNEQAANKAKAYLDIMSYSREDLINQLEYEGFTHDQAVYGAQANEL